MATTTTTATTTKKKKQRAVWTKETALRAITRCNGLTWCSALDYLCNHCGYNARMLLHDHNG